MGRTNLTGVALIVAAAVLVAGCSKPASPKLSPEAAQQSRLDWNLKSLVGAYQDIGNTDRAWDDAAERALTEFARTRAEKTDPDEPWGEIIATNCDAAVKAGCDDPMVRYLYVRFSMNQTNTPKTFSDAYDEVQSNMQASLYPDIRKYYASVRAYQQFYYAYGTGNNNVDYTRAYEMFNNAISNLVATLNDKTTPPEETYEACDDLINSLPGDPKAFENYYEEIQAPLFANWPDEATSWLFKGHAYIAQAWNYRGNGYADTITVEGAKGFDKSLAMADKALNQAWKLNPTDARIAVAMISVELGQGEGRDRMELWFNRAMQDDPNDYDACSAKLNYLQPKWYGSEEDMVEFGRECVTNTDWGGLVPLILVDAHYDIDNEYTNEVDRANYWKESDVWADLSSSYERYFQDYPNDAGRIAYYARYAYYAEQWNKLNQLLPKVDPSYYYLFGGADKFNQIVMLAKQNASPP